jgi:hypothetical protein
MRTVGTKGGASKLSVACGQWQKNVNGIIIRKKKSRSGGGTV